MEDISGSHRLKHQLLAGDIIGHKISHKLPYKLSARVRERIVCEKFTIWEELISEIRAQLFESIETVMENKSLCGVFFFGVTDLVFCVVLGCVHSGQPTVTSRIL